MNTTARRYTASLDDDSLAALDHANAKTGLDSSVILRALIFAYTSGKPSGLPFCPPLKSSVKRLELVSTNGLRSL